MALKGYKRSIKLEFDYNEIKSGVPDVRKQMAILNAEFKKTSSEAAANGTTIDSLGAKYDYLGNKLKIQEQEVENYRKKLEQAQNAQGNNTKAVQNATTSLEIAQAKLSQTRAEMEKVSNELDYQQNAINKNSTEWESLEYQLGLIDAAYIKANAEADISSKQIDKLNAEHLKLTDTLRIHEKQVEILKEKLNDATTAENVNEQAVRENKKELADAEAQLAQTRAALNKVTKELKDQHPILGKTSDEWGKIGDKTSAIGKSMTTKLTLPILAAMAASFKLGADFEQALGKMEVVFEDNSKSIEKWAQNSLRDFGLARSTAITMASDFGALFKGMGIDMLKTEEWSKTLTERTMDLANFYDTTVAETTNALNAIVTGQTEPLRKFGINMTQASLQEFALSQRIRKRVSDMTEAEKVQLRYNFVIEKTNIAVGTTARESDSATGQMNLFKESVKELGERFSEHILPIFTPVIEGLNNIITLFAGLSDGTKKFIIVAGGLVAIVGPILLAVGSVFKAISSISAGLEAVPKVIEGVSKAGSAIMKTLSATGSWGFKEWAIVIAGIVALLLALVVALDAVFNKGRGMQRFVGGIKELMGSIPQSVQNTAVRGYAVGTNYIQQDQVAVVHKGEAIIPADQNPYNPNATRYDGQGNGDTFILNVDMDEIGDVEKLINTMKQLKQRRRAGMVMG